MTKILKIGLQSAMGLQTAASLDNKLRRDYKREGLQSDTVHLVRYYIFL